MTVSQDTQPIAGPTEASVPVATEVAPRREVIYRHSLVVRLTHWLNLLFLVLLLLSGLRLFNFHPALYWGNYGYKGAPSLLAIGAARDPSTNQLVGIMQIGETQFITTGVLGASYSPSQDRTVQQAFPFWLTLPVDLGQARGWHFALAWLFVLNGAAYLLYGLFGHFRRDLLPRSDQLRPRHILSNLWDHIRLRPPRGEAARRYNVLQKFTYLIVIFLLLPLMLLTGLTMSPGFTTAAPFLFDVFGGRQSARTIHFVVANLLVLFVLIHVLEVLLAGAINLMRSMITGRYIISTKGAA
jgi:thiosulfate reductase cytochrome b subunit